MEYHSTSKRMYESLEVIFMIGEGISRKILAWTLVGLMIGSVLGVIPAGALKTLNETTNGVQTDTVDFASAGSDNTSIGLKLPKGAAGNIVNATFDVKGLPHTVGEKDYPLSPTIDIGDTGTNEWEFSALGFGQMGHQRLFKKDTDMVNEDTITYSSAGSEDDLKLRLPYTANIQSATVEIEGSLESLETQLNDSVAGEIPGDYFGEAMTHGDFNNDGFEDLVVSAKLTIDGGTVYLFNGTATGYNSSADINFTDPVSPLDMFSFDLTAGDYNNDGFDDLVISGPAGGTGGEGFVAILPGSANGPSVPGVTAFQGLTNSDNFGWSVATANVNGDNFDDLVVAAPGVSGTNGAVYIFHGSGTGIDPGTAASADTTITHDDNLDFFGTVVATCGDIDNDGNDDIAIGAPGALNMAGKVFVFMGTALGINNDPSSNADVILQGMRNATMYDGMGNAIDTAGDVNGDGYDDLIVGGENYNMSSSGSDTIDGRVWIFYGNSSGLAQDENTALTPAMVDEGFGLLSVSSAGDLDADGYDDILVGAHRRQNDNGGVDIFLGGEDGVQEDLVGSLPGGPIESFGIAIMPMGDLNGDGFGDFAVGGPGNNADIGAVFIYHANPQYPSWRVQYRCPAGHSQRPDPVSHEYQHYLKRYLRKRICGA